MSAKQHWSASKKRWIPFDELNNYHLANAIQSIRKRVLADDPTVTDEDRTHLLDLEAEAKARGLTA